MNKIVNMNGAILFWTSRKITRTDAKSAFKKQGFESFVPKLDPYEALKGTAKELVEACGLKGKGISIEYPSLDRKSCGLEVIASTKGDKRNQHQFLFSIGALSTGGVGLLDVDSTACPIIAANYSQVEAAANGLWTEQVKFLPAKDLTDALVSLVKHSKGVLLKESGGVYFVADEYLHWYRGIGTDLAPLGPSLSSATFGVTSNKALFKQVIDAVIEEVKIEVAAMQQEIADLHSNQKNQRANGEKRRMEQLCELEAKWAYYAKYAGDNGIQMPNLQPAIDACRQAIAAAALQKFRRKGA
jgi:hypothetical protein